MQLSGKGSACLIIGVLLAGGGVYVLIKYGIASAPIFLIAAILIFLAFAVGRDYSAEDAEKTPVSVQSAPVVRARFRRLPETIDCDGVRFDAKYHYAAVGFENIADAELMTPVQFRLKDGYAEIFTGGKLCGKLAPGLFVNMIYDFNYRKEPFGGQIDGEHPNTLELAFYKKHPALSDYERAGIESKVFSLAGTGMEDYELTASITQEGEELAVRYDAEKDRYETDAGYLPADANDFLGDDTVGFVESVAEHDNGRRIIKLRVFERAL